MIINNYELIKPLLAFPEKCELIDNELSFNCDYFYVVQLIQRKKDNPSKLINPNARTNSNRSVYQTFIYSEKDFEEKMPTLIKMAKLFQARVYINLNLKSSYDAFIKLFKNMGCRMENDNYTHLSRIYNEAVGECKGSVFYKDRWIVDIDNLPESHIHEVIKLIESLRGGGNNGKGYVFAEIPTKNGCHLITSSFDLKRFKDNYPSIDVHKDNPTILWMNTDWINYE